MFFDVFLKTLRYVFFLNETTIETIYPSSHQILICKLVKSKTCANILLLFSGLFCHSKLHKFSQILAFILSVDNDDMVA